MPLPLPSFSEWLVNRAQEPPQADRLATVIAQAGAAGVSIDRLRRIVGLSPETLADVLKSLVATGQVVVLKVGGQMTYRATM
jgi:predicted transcriptional regulator